LGRCRVWGSKAYLLTNASDRRKDWEEKAKTGHFVRYSDTKQGWTVWLPEYQKHETSVHVLFDEQPPLREDEYFKELKASTVKENPDAQSLEDFLYLVGTHHVDEGFLYKTTRVIVRKGLIVGYRALITSGRQMVEEQVSIHIADIVLMTNNYEEDSALTVAWDANSTDHVPSREESLHFFGGLRSPVGTVASREARAENSTGREMSRTAEIRENPPMIASSAVAVAGAEGVEQSCSQRTGHSSGQRRSQNTVERGPGSNCNPERNSTVSVAGKSEGLATEAVQLDQPGSRQRKRKQRVLANVAKLGEINSLEAVTMGEAVAQVNMLRDHTEILYEEPTTYQQSLDSPQAEDWKGARLREKASLRKRKVMGLHQIPEGAKLI
jgi:hypothetical protein